jgi:hypothetical protein
MKLYAVELTFGTPKTKDRRLVSFRRLDGLGKRDVSPFRRNFEGDGAFREKRSKNIKKMRILT